jgi:hypothetical protein
MTNGAVGVVDRNGPWGGGEAGEIDGVRADPALNGMA